MGDCDLRWRRFCPPWPLFPAVGKQWRGEEWCKLLNIHLHGSLPPCTPSSSGLRVTAMGLHPVAATEEDPHLLMAQEAMVTSSHKRWVVLIF